MRPQLPRLASLRPRLAFENNLRGRDLPGRESPVAGGVPGAHRAPEQSGSFSCVLRPDRQLARAACRGRSGLFAYAYYTPQFITQHILLRPFPGLGYGCVNASKSRAKASDRSVRPTQDCPPHTGHFLEFFYDLGNPDSSPSVFALTIPLRQSKLIVRGVRMSSASTTLPVLSAASSATPASPTASTAGVSVTAATPAGLSVTAAAPAGSGGPSASAAAPAAKAAPFSTPALLGAMLRSAPKISDLFFSPGKPPMVEVNGRLVPTGPRAMTPEDTQHVASELIGNAEYALGNLREQGSCDVSYSLPGASRFRVNVFMQRGSCAIVMRVIPSKVPSFAELNLPAELQQIVGLRNGIVLVTGPTGSGKSSTLAAIIDLINKTP